MGETRNREYFSRKCRRKSIELCHCQIQRRSSMKAVIILLLNLSESELIRDGKKWAASRNHCYCWCSFLHHVLSKVVNINISHKENQWQFVSIFWTNIYAVKYLIIHEKQFKSSNHLLFSGFFFRISSNTGAAPVISPSAVPYTNTLWVPPPSKFDILCTLMYSRLLTVQYQCKPAIYWTESCQSL